MSLTAKRWTVVLFTFSSIAAACGGSSDDTIAPSDLLESVDFTGTCTYDGRSDYEDAAYTGAHDVWLDCGGTPTAIVILKAYPATQDFVVFVQIQVVSDADLEALDVILASFNVVVD